MQANEPMPLRLRSNAGLGGPIRSEESMARSINVAQWLKSGEYLPEPLRDFHDQKAVFKAMHEIMREDPAAMVRRPGWIEGQCYVIDVFLWFMARRGWTLQRTRRQGDFRDLETDVRARTEARDAAAAALLGLTLLADNKTPNLLMEARKIVRASSARNLVKDWDARATAALEEKP